MSRRFDLTGPRAVALVAVLVGLLLGAVGGAAGGFLSRGDEVDRLDDRIVALMADLEVARQAQTDAEARALERTDLAASVQRDLDAADLRIAQLETQVEELSLTNADALQLQADLEALRAANDELDAQLRGLEGEISSVRAQRDNAIADLGALQTINSLNISPDPLRYDPESPTDVIRALCTGSMEPTIGCNDSLLVYSPDRQDLDVGDIIVFWQPTADCSSINVGAGILHRIVQIVRSPSGELSFRTQGDALPNRDPCPVPFNAVVSKVAAIIFDASLDAN